MFVACRIPPSGEQGRESSTDRMSKSFRTQLPGSSLKVNDGGKVISGIECELVCSSLVRLPSTALLPGDGINGSGV